MKEFEYPSKGGGSIHAYQWQPQDTPVAVVQIVHGIAEHMLRYDDFARFLNANGMIVVGEDHMGHGRSIGEGTPLYFEGGWENAADDTYELLRRTRAEYPDLGGKLRFGAGRTGGPDPRRGGRLPSRGAVRSPRHDPFL